MNTVPVHFQYDAAAANDDGGVDNIKIRSS